MDPFEARLEFIGMLQHISSSHQTIERISHFAISNEQCAENLGDCIVEQSSELAINLRPNLVYVIDAICDKAIKQQQAQHPHFDHTT
ncbi:CTD kinase subunit gamma, partial [Smittium mucronatum]